MFSDKCFFIGHIRFNDISIPCSNKYSFHRVFYNLNNLLDVQKEKKNQIVLNVLIKIT